MEEPHEQSWYLTKHMPDFNRYLNQTFRSLDKSLAIFKWELEFDNDQEDPLRSQSLCDQRNSEQIHHFLSWSRVRKGQRHIIRLD